MKRLFDVFLCVFVSVVLIFLIVLICVQPSKSINIEQQKSAVKLSASFQKLSNAILQLGQERDSLRKQVQDLQVENSILREQIRLLNEQEKESE